MLAVVDDARVRAGDGHAAWSESFNEMFAQVAGVFSNARGAAARAGVPAGAAVAARSGRTPGRWRSSPATCRRTGCSGC